MTIVKAVVNESNRFVGFMEGTTVEQIHAKIKALNLKPLGYCIFCGDEE